MVGSLRWGFLLLVLTIALIAPPTDAFLTSLRTSSSTARVGRAIGPLRLRLAADTVRLSSSASDGATILQKRSTVKIDAQTLLRLLVQPRASAQSKDDPTLKIRSLITRLSEAQVAFDPAQCLNGPLYAVLHQQGPKVPRWEKIGRLLPNNTNIKGQQFVFRPDTQSFDIVNYAEVFGRGMSRTNWM